MKSLLTIDIGNSTVCLGLFPEPFKNDTVFIKKFPCLPATSGQFYKKIISGFIKEKTGRAVTPGSFDAVLSSVVPSLNGPVVASVKIMTGKRPLVVSHKSKTGLILDLVRPGKTGSDRIANAVAGACYCNKPFAVADIGTATTITVVGQKRNLIGGAILPGPELMNKALHSETAKLPLISLTRPITALGKETTSAITSGIVLGTAGAIEALINAMEKETGYKLKLILTGGLGGLLSPLIKKEHLLIPDLTLKGLRLIYLKSRNMSGH